MNDDVSHKHMFSGVPEGGGVPKLRNLTIAAMIGQAKSSGPKMVKGPIYFWTQKFGVH